MVFGSGNIPSTVTSFSRYPCYVIARPELLDPQRAYLWVTEVDIWFGNLQNLRMPPFSSLPSRKTLQLDFRIAFSIAGIT